MRIGRIELGLIRDGKTGKLKLEDFFDLCSSTCGCFIISIGYFYITVLSSECRDSLRKG